MAGISSPIFRVLCRRMGASMAFTEMVSAKGLLLKNSNTWRYLEIDPEEHPVGAQLFGNSPEEMARAAEIVEEAGFDVVDVNMGCPVRKVVSLGAGAALMNDPQRAARIVEAMVRRVKIPVTAKIRSGWSSDCICAVEVARILEKAGVSAVIVHPRTRDQGYGGSADWKVIAQVKAALNIPCIGNGDVRNAETAKNLLKTSNCDGIMIGRASLGNPWVFQEVSAALKNEALPPPPKNRERYALLLAHLRGLRREMGSKRALRKMRKVGAYYIKGLRGAPAARKALHESTTLKGALATLKAVFFGTADSTAS